MRKTKHTSCLHLYKVLNNQDLWGWMLGPDRGCCWSRIETAGHRVGVGEVHSQELVMFCFWSGGWLHGHVQFVKIHELVYLWAEHFSMSIVIVSIKDSEVFKKRVICRKAVYELYWQTYCQCAIYFDIQKEQAWKETFQTMTASGWWKCDWIDFLGFSVLSTFSAMCVHYIY